MEPCQECGGKGYVNRKVWDDSTERAMAGKVHPSTLAGIPAQRTIKRFSCSLGCKEEKSG